MDQRFMVETLKLLKENTERSRHKQLFSDWDFNCPGNKNKNRQMGLHQIKKFLLIGGNSY
jgi:hypothetical protein